MATQIFEPHDDSLDVVSAHEIGTFVFCPEQWRLEYGLGLEPGNQTALRSGSRHHERKQTAERTAGRLLQIGQKVIAAGLILLFVLWILGR
ncbi:hypothetical protein [Tautonia sociabilis]|uniref:Uncharacterized protein n=1 Tax=Tautonia sociabilis TaxID=2080755 RepID=A0A432MPR3_9BACT|nr:hypothetical protein [Tautonia sociabilis]RUL89463.1 hypothetical protein TsocGM_01435 [Tautonia sociabilis]